MTTSPNSPSPRFPWALLILVLFVVGAAGTFSWMGRHARPGEVSLPVYGEVPDFRFEEAKGRAVGRGELLGHPWIADFIFTNCAGSCPAMTLAMAGLQESLARVPEARLVSFTVDPERDTLAALREYAAARRADPERWYFLRGSKEEVDRLAREAFKLGVTREGGSAAEPIIHSQKLVLVDRRGRIRAYFDGSDPEVLARVLTALGQLLREGRSG